MTEKIKMIPPPVERPAPVLSLRGLTKTFGAVRALTDVNIDVYPHEVVALVGDNGAGKSTVAKIVSGVFPPDSGTITVGGQYVTIPHPSAAHTLGIATVFQHLALADNLDVVGNVFLGRELTRGHLLDEQEMEKQTRFVLDQLSSTILNVRTKVADLSGGQRQSVAIARSLLGQPRIVVLDEPTASLSVAQSAEILNHIQRMRAMNHGVILISHNLVDVQAVADRIIVLRHGRINGEFDAATASYEDIIACITGARSALGATYRIGR